MKDFGQPNAIEDSLDEIERKVAVDIVCVIGLSGCVAVLAVDLFIRAKDDEIATRSKYAEPLSKNGLGVGVVFQQVGGIDEIEDPIPEPLEILSLAGEVGRAACRRGRTDGANRRGWHGE